MRGNGDTVEQNNRAPLIYIHAGRFRVERGLFENCSKDGMMVSCEPGKEIVGGVVRDLVGRKVIRDTVSISGDGKQGAKVRDVLVENIKAYDSELRGAVEVSDGAEDITVRNVYAENCVYGIDIQDHGQKLQINRNVTISQLEAVNCKYAVRNANHPFGHSTISISDVTARDCGQALQLKNTENYTIRNVRVFAQSRNGQNAILVSNCHGVSIEGVTIEGGAAEGAGLLIENSNRVTVRNLTIAGTRNSYAHGVKVTASHGDFSSINLSQIDALHVGAAGILLEKGKGGSLSDYTVANNRAQVQDLVGGRGRVIENNTGPSR